MESVGGGRSGPPGDAHQESSESSEMVDDVGGAFAVEERGQVGEEAHRLGRASYLCDLRHDVDQTSVATMPVPEPGAVSRWRMKDREIRAVYGHPTSEGLMKTGYVALVMCLNIGVDPPDVIKISPCARMECWIDPLSTTSSKALDAIGKSLQAQYERWQPRAKYKVCLDPTVEEVKKLCMHCRKNARNERVLFHYNGHGVPRPTVNGEIWLFNKDFLESAVALVENNYTMTEYILRDSPHFTQYIPLSVYELESCLGNPSIYVFDCSAAGMIVNAFCERQDYGSTGGPSTPSTPAMRDCLLLAACGAHETLPQNSNLPADVFTACLTTPIKIALRWFCPRSLLSLHPDLIDQIPGRQNDRKTPLGELNWIFTAITDTIAWNVLPRDLFQRLFRQDLLVASLFRNFLLAERIMRDANCCPQSFPRLPPTHQHSMWHAWDMAAEICLSQLPTLLSDPAAEFQPSPFFTEQLTAFEVWLEHGSEMKKPPEQLPIVLQVLLSQSHRFRALVLLGRFLDMGAWAVDLALSVGIFPYVLKLLQTTATDLRQILVFIWTKILALDKSCQIDLVKDGGHVYFIQFLKSSDIHPEQRAMAAFVLAVIVDGHPRGQEACITAKPGLISICLSHIQDSTNSPEGQPEPLLLQWLCLCLGKLWDESSDGLTLAFQDNAPAILGKVLSEPQPEVRAAATFALGTLVKVGSDLPPNNVGSDDDLDEATEVAEEVIARCLLKVLCDGSPLVRAELAIALARLASSHNGMFRLAAAAYLKPPSHSTVLQASGAGHKSPGGFLSPTVVPGASHSDADQGPQTIDGRTPNQPGFGGVSSSGSLEGSTGTSALSGSHVLGESAGFGTPNNAGSRAWKRSGDGNVYVQCVTAVYALARDPFPRVACLGRQVLRIMGVESAQIMMAAKAGANRSVGHQRNSSVPALPPTPSIAGILHRSTSWVASTSGNLASTWRSSTPPPSPPTRQPFLGGPPGGLRRAASMDMSAALNAPWDTPKAPVTGVQALSPAPSTRNANTGLADTPGMTTPQLTPQGPSAVNHEPADPASLLPESIFYRWSCGHFSRSLLDPVHDDEEENLARRERREKEALKGIEMCQHSRVNKVSDQIASWDTGSETGTKAVLLHPFKPLICIADEKETIRIWDYEEAAVVNTFDNHNTPDKGVSKLCLLNELDDSLLLVASSDGSVRVWKDYTQTGNHRLATAWQTVQGHKPGSRSISAVVDWHQMSGYLYASGQISWIMVWDLDREQLISTMSSHSDSSVSAMSACQTQNAHVVAGCGDGSVRLYDIRSRDMLVCAMKPHAQKVVGLDFQPGVDFSKIISASPAGDLKFLDMRNSSAPYLEIEAHKGHLTTLAVHRHAPVIATGSGKQLIKTFSTSGEQLSMVRYHNSFLGQRIGPVSALGFHPYKVLLAAGAVDSLVSIYAGESVQGG